jgi:hypothetical protein
MVLNSPVLSFLSLVTALSSLYGEDTFLEAFQNTTLSRYGKTMYVHDDRLYPKLDQSTFGIGGKSPSIQDTAMG